MQKVNWWVVGIISAVVVLLLSGGGMMMGGGWGMMNGYGMMGNWGHSPFAWVGMLFMGLTSIAIVVLSVLGVVWLVQKVGKSTPPSS
jgi:hypothetical protein